MSDAKKTPRARRSAARPTTAAAGDAGKRPAKATTRRSGGRGSTVETRAGGSRGSNPVRRPRPLKLPDPRLTRLAERGAQAFELTLAKTLLHEDDARRYPLPSDARSIERRLERALSELPKGKRRKLRDHYAPAAEAAAAERRKRFGDLAAIDLRSAESVIDQVRRRPVPADLRLTAAEIDRAAGRLRKSFLPTAQRVPRGDEPPGAMISRLRRIECIEETRELGKDEIAVAFNILDNLGNSVQVGPIDFGKFKTGDVIDLAAAPRQIFTFDLTEGEFPKAFAVSYSLTEEDPIRLNFLEILAIAGYALVAAGIGVMVVAGAAIPLALILSAVGLAMFPLIAILFPALPPAARPFSAQSLVEFPDAGNLTFIDENGEKSDVSIPETFTFSLFGGRYELTTDFLLV